MIKKEIAKRILLKNGNPISLNDFTYDLTTNTISTSKSHLVFNFSGLVGFKFITGSSCTFNIGSYCIFKTGYNCNFNTGSNCTFNTGYGCTFNTESNCTFKTDSYCTFDTSHSCTFTTNDNCVCIRRDIFEIIEIPKNKTIKLNSVNSKGYTIINNFNNNPTIDINITINDKKINLTDISIENNKIVVKI